MQGYWRSAAVTEEEEENAEVNRRQSVNDRFLTLLFAEIRSRYAIEDEFIEWFVNTFRSDAVDRLQYLDKGTGRSLSIEERFSHGRHPSDTWIQYSIQYSSLSDLA
jgi:hypothetical protein